MGCVSTITHEKFPKQSKDVGEKVMVYFHYNFSFAFPGTVVRDDMEKPFRMIIKLDDGRYVMGHECGYNFV